MIEYPFELSTQSQTFEFEFEQNPVYEFTVDQAIEVVGGEHYQGEYIITPSPSDAIVLETEGKVMDDDVTVIKIPYYETSNVTGKTVYIASEV